jgi:hypothetical protein
VTDPSESATAEAMRSAKAHKLGSIRSRVSAGQASRVDASVVRIQRDSYRSLVAVFIRAARRSAWAGAVSPATPDAPDGSAPCASRYDSRTRAALPAVAGAAIDVPLPVA